jgi:hypothetical protein
MWLGSVCVSAQELPKKIRGYTVHKEQIAITEDTDPNGPLLSVGEPGLADVTLSGITFELPLSFNSPDQSGKVDFLTFHEFRVNGIPVTIGEYDQPFAFRKNEVVQLGSPISVFLPTGRLIQAAWLEMHDSKDDWKVEGRVFVFGRFRKFGFYHKRVVPIDIDLLVKNPVRK